MVENMSEMCAKTIIVNSSCKRAEKFNQKHEHEKAATRT